MTGGIGLGAEMLGTTRSATSHCKDFLYSVNTRLAYNINEEFYGGRHYVWCAPRFDAAGNPDVSNPKKIVEQYFADIRGRGLNSVSLRANRMGICMGANKRLSEGLITSEQYVAIRGKMERAKAEDFQPLLYIVNQQAVKGRKDIPHWWLKASPGSQECTIKDLGTAEFDIVDFSDMGGLYNV